MLSCSIGTGSPSRTCQDVRNDSQVLEFGLSFTRMATPEFAEPCVSEERDCAEHSQGQQAHTWLSTAVLCRGQRVRLLLQKPILDFGISSGLPRGIQAGKTQCLNLSCSLTSSGV